jgi:hypothetical protein
LSESDDDGALGRQKLDPLGQASDVGGRVFGGSRGGAGRRLFVDRAEPPADRGAVAGTHADREQRVADAAADIGV